MAFFGAIFLAFGLHGNFSSASAPPLSSKAVGTKDPYMASPLAEPPPAEPKAAGSRRSPVNLRIPSIDVSANITSLGLNDDKTVEVPGDPKDAGWYDKGPLPGENGSAVILGHVDSTHGPAVFARLKNLRPGDQIAVKLSDDTVTHYQVARVTHYANEDFPASKVYAGSPERPALNLVTCGGKYDRAAGGYQANVVVYAKYLWATDGDVTPRERRPSKRDS